MRQTLVAGNWKMNGSKDSIITLLDGIKQGLDTVNSNTHIAVCAPAIYLSLVAEQLTGTAIKWGGQTLSKENSGAFTGEISANMLLDFACEYVLVGHSERRSLYNETDQDIADKFSAAQTAGLTPILCVGELLEERESGNTETVVARQLDTIITQSGIDALKNAVIAYEPVWAIGTGKTASPAQAQEVHAFIRARIAEQSKEVAEQVQILYGGSMNAANAKELIAQTDIDGGLIGGASLKPADFLTICKA